MLHVGRDKFNRRTHLKQVLQQSSSENNVSEFKYNFIQFVVVCMINAPS